VEKSPWLMPSLDASSRWGSPSALRLRRSNSPTCAATVKRCSLSPELLAILINPIYQYYRLNQVISMVNNLAKKVGRLQLEASFNACTINKTKNPITGRSPSAHPMFSGVLTDARRNIYVLAAHDAADSTR